MTTRAIFRRNAFAYSSRAREIRAPGDIQLLDDELLGHDSTASRGRVPVSSTASSPTLKLTLFGGPSLSHESEVLSLSPFQGALLGVLATHGQRGIRRGELISLLWSEGDGDSLRRRLNQLIYSLHRRLDETRIVRLVGDVYMFEEGRVSSDLEFFLGAIRDSRLADAMGVVGRGFLSGLESTPSAAFERWVESREWRFRSDVRTLASDRWREAEQRADWLMAEEAADSLLRLDPYDEGSLRKLLESRALRGHVREAESTYVEFLELARIEDPEYELEEETERLFSRLRELGSASMTRRPNLSTRSSSDTSHFVGRVDELRHLTGTIRGIRDEGIQFLLVTGEGGIGKTRLIHEALARAPFDGVRVLSGRCSEFEKSIPMSPILSSLDGSSWVSHSIQELADPWRSTLTNLLPNEEPDSEVVEAVRPIPEEDLPRVTCEAFLRLFRALARTDPLVLFFDDFHWIDATSLSILAYVRERWTGGGLCIIGALREGDVEPGSQLGRWLSAGSASQHISALALSPLPRADIESLLRRSLSANGEVNDDQDASGPAWLESVVEFSDGHPLLALECVRSLEADGTDRTMDSRRLPVPQGIQEMVSLRVSKLSADGARIVSLLSASDKPLGVSVLEVASGLGQSALTHAIDDGMSRCLLDVSPGGVDYQHGLLRNAVYRRLSSGQRINAHRCIAEALLSQSEAPPVLDVALHLLMAADPRRAMPYVLDAARAASDAGGWTEAKHLLTMALESDPTVSERADIAALLGHVLFLLGNLEDAINRWEEAEACYCAVGRNDEALEARLSKLEVQRLRPGSDRTALLETLRELREEASDRNLRKLVADCLSAEVRLLDGLRRFDDVRVLTSGVLNLVDPEDVESHIQLLLVSAVDAVYGDPARAEKLADEAAGIARAHNLPDLLLKALNWKIVSYYHQARLCTREGEDLIQDAMSSARQSSDNEQRFWFECNVGAWNVEVGELIAAERSFKRAEAALERHPLPHHRRNLLINRGQLALELEDYEMALNLFTDGLGSPVSHPLEPSNCFALAGLGIAQFHQGNVDEARRILGLLPSRPTLWTFDPFLWLSFEAKVLALSIPRDRLLATMREFELGLRESVPTAWIRMRLLRFDIAFRSGASPLTREIEDLASFLEDRKIRIRKGELDRMLERYRSRRNPRC